MSKQQTHLLGYAILLVMLTILLVLIGDELRAPQSFFAPIPSAGLTIPHFELEDLWQANIAFTEKTLPEGQVNLLHVWGSWCSACQREHAMLMKMAKFYRIPIYSLDYKDNPDAAKSWLIEKGNPYVATGIDPYGRISRSLGVYGTPVTFLVDKHGIIRYRHIGTIDDTTWRDEIFPLITQYRQTNP